MDWDFIRLSDDDTIHIQLNFDKPDQVSLYDPVDRIRIKFWN